jgi:sulfate adenylyltransferase large subunit
MADLLRLCTAGSVDDGKSTLIGRLLCDSRSVYEDQLRSVTDASRHRGAGVIDFSLFTDGLRAEREQGITIDVAYRYCATARRRFILADTPGHEQYTRNMATGASTADLAILLVDARHGLREQTRRHARIATLLGVGTLVLAVNKMDLVGFDRHVFEAIAADFAALAPGADVQAIPLSALLGDNIVEPSARMDWNDEPTLLRYLEQVPAGPARPATPFRFPVQTVVRLDGYRGLAGQITFGSVRPGDIVTIFPSRQTAAVDRIVTWDGDLAEAHAPMSVSLVLDRHLDVARGDLVAIDPPVITRRFAADLVWMDEQPLQPESPYLLKHGARTVQATVDRTLALNDIGRVSVRTSEPLCIDGYANVRAGGAFILIDPDTYFTSAAGMVVG